MAITESPTISSTGHEDINAIAQQLAKLAKTSDADTLQALAELFNTTIQNRKELAMIQAANAAYLDELNNLSKLL